MDQQPASLPPFPATGCPLDVLRGLRTAPALTADQILQLRAILDSAMARCSWFTVGVMAPSVAAAIAALRSLEACYSWQPLQPFDTASEASDCDGVFLKANQATGLFACRAEAGLGEGILITGHNPGDPAVENTWGPFPLHFFG